LLQLVNYRLRAVAAVSFANLPINDAEGRFKETYGSKPFAMLVRPDGYLAWRGNSWREAALRRQLDRTFVPKEPSEVRS